MASELISLGIFIVSVGLAFFIFAFAYMFWQVARSSKMSVDRDMPYYLMEELQLNKYALEKGIDIDKERAKRSIIKVRKSKSFIKRLEEEIITDFFGKEKEEQIKLTKQ